MKYFLAIVSFLFSFLGVAIIVGMFVLVLFSPNPQLAFVGVGLSWKILPGTILGFWAGIHSAQVALRSAEDKERKRRSKDES